MYFYTFLSSTDPGFKKDLITVRTESESEGIVARRLTGSIYYVRARLGYYDSAGEAVFGQWSNVERAARGFMIRAQLLSDYRKIEE